MSQEEKEDENDALSDWESEDEEMLKETTEYMIMRCKEMMSNNRGTSWGDHAAFELISSLLLKYDLPEWQHAPCFNSNTSKQTIVWTKPKAAQVEFIVCSAMPIAKVTLSKHGDKGYRVFESLGYEEAVEKLSAWFRV